MKVASLPVFEIDGLPTQQRLFLPEEHANFHVCSHRNPSVVVLRLLNHSISVDAASLQEAIREVIAKSES